MGFDPAALEASRDASRLVDPDLAVEIVASELAEAHFQTVVNTIDDRLDGAAAMGRIMSCIYVEHTTDWPMQRSWYHDLYLTLARIEGCLGIDVSSDCMQERAVKHYLREMRALVNAHVLARDALRSAGHAEDTEELLARPPASPQLRLL